MLLIIAGIILAALGSLLFSTLTYSLRDFSRVRLADRLEAAGAARWLEPTVEHRDDLIFVTAALRLLFNMLVLLGVMAALHGRLEQWAQYAAAFAITGMISLLFSVALPHALMTYAGEAIIAMFVGFLHTLRYLLFPVTKVMHVVDDLVRKVAGAPRESQAQDIEQDIVSVVEEGVKEGVVDEQEREMIESVIEFRDTQVGQIMTTRRDVVALELTASLAEVVRTIVETGHSRVPVYDGSLDHIVGVLYARDLLKSLGRPPEQFDIRSAMRPAIFVPETKPLRDLLREFRAQKVHIALVLDEYGGTAGVVTIEDILEELVGDISDEHEPLATSTLRKVDAHIWEADAGLEVDDANRRIGLDIPTDAGYVTLGGYVSILFGRIPPAGATLTHEGVRFTILDAVPQRVKRVKVETLPAAAEAAPGDAPTPESQSA